MTCPLCGTLAAQWWQDLYHLLLSYDEGSDTPRRVEGLRSVNCSACDAYSYWFEDKMVYPLERIGPPPHIDMPPSVLTLYREAQEIAKPSPRAAAVLLRIALERLLEDVGRGGKNLNKAIGDYVAEGAIPEELQRAMDTVRLTGNDAAHPGELKLDDTPGGTAALFEIVNELVDRLVGFKARMNRIYDSLDGEKKEQVERRDSPSS
jgi:hypothetical protein